MSSQLEIWSEELQRSELSREIGRAEQLLRLHNESVSHMQNTTFQVLQQGQELAQVWFYKYKKKTAGLLKSITSFLSTGWH